MVRQKIIVITREFGGKKILANFRVVLNLSDFQDSSVSALFRAGYVVDAVSPMDLVSSGTLLHYTPLYGQLPRESNAHVCGESGVLSRGSVPERPEPQPVGGCYEHLHARV